MKKQIFAVFSSLDSADLAINEVHNTLSVSADEISYVYRNKDGERVSGDGSDIATSTPGEGAATGATTGGVIGAVIGIVASAGVLGPIGGVVAAGPLLTALGITGAVGATVATAATGAVAGGLIGALTNMGVGEPKAREIEERVKAGDVLVHVHAENVDEVVRIFQEHGATSIEMITDTV
jgi:hypothetical protein